MMEEFRQKGVPGRRRVYFPNWLRTTSAVARSKGEFRKRFNIPSDHLLAVYSGNLGRKQGIDVLLETATQLASPDRAGRINKITLVIVGAGAERDALERRVKALALSNLRLLPLLSDEDYAMMLADADLGLITQASGTGQFFFPSKLLSLLQAGLPVATVADADSELARAVAEGGFGVNVLPGRADELTLALRTLSEDPARLRQMAEQAVWVERFSPSVVLPQFARELVRIVTGPSETPTIVSQHEPSRL
jgi:colanic acid biosynthesis glycosyl transferase WcaI